MKEQGVQKVGGGAVSVGTGLGLAAEREEQEHRFDGWLMVLAAAPQHRLEVELFQNKWKHASCR